MTFAGNTVTSRDTVERYLLFRAAELTTQQGYDYFVLAERDTDKKQRTYANSFGGGYGGGYGFWRWLWRRVRLRLWRLGSALALLRPRLSAGAHGIRSLAARSSITTSTFNTVEKYEATAEIVLGKGLEARR